MQYKIPLQLLEPYVNIIYGALQKFKWLCWILLRQTSTTTTNYWVRMVFVHIGVFSEFTLQIISTSYQIWWGVGEAWGGGVVISIVAKVIVVVPVVVPYASISISVWPIPSSFATVLRP